MIWELFSLLISRLVGSYSTYKSLRIRDMLTDINQIQELIMPVGPMRTASIDKPSMIMIIHANEHDLTSIEQYHDFEKELNAIGTVDIQEYAARAAFGTKLSLTKVILIELMREASR